MNARDGVCTACSPTINHAKQLVMLRLSASHLITIIIIIIFIIALNNCFFIKKYFNFFTFWDGPELFLNVPCSGFYRQP